MAIRVVGLDQGFAKTRRSTGLVVAELQGRQLVPLHGPEHLLYVEARKKLQRIIRDNEIDAICVDAPVGVSTPAAYRSVERVFSLGMFQKLCKPGSAGAPVGRRLAKACADTVNRAPRARYVPFGALTNRRGAHVPVIECFPTLTLAVMQDPSTLPSAPRGKKTDTYYESLITTTGPTLAGVTLDDALLPAACRNHDQRMAAVCALVAAWFAKDRFRAVGDATGYFVLPPVSAWNRAWRQEFQKARRRQPVQVIDVPPR